jgi:hypothetical protein
VQPRQQCHPNSQNPHRNPELHICQNRFKHWDKPNGIIFRCQKQPQSGYSISVPTFHTVTPMIPTGGSLADALQFYTQQMGFKVTWQADNGAGIARDGVAFNLVVNSNREWADNSSYSIGVTGLDALYAEYRNLSVRIGALEMKTWGRREFHMIVPSGVCLQFYEHG